MKGNGYPFPFLLSAVADLPQKALAAAHDVGIGAVKIAVIPRVGDIAAARVGEQQAQLVLPVLSDDALGVSQVVSVHAQQMIVAVVVVPRELHRALAFAGNSVSRQLAFCGRINGIAPVAPDLLAAGGGGGYEKILRDAALLHHILQNELRHRTSANVAVADKHYPYHLYPSFHYMLQHTTNLPSAQVSCCLLAMCAV